MGVLVCMSGIMMSEGGNVFLAPLMASSSTFGTSSPKSSLSLSATDLHALVPTTTNQYTNEQQALIADLMCMVASVFIAIDIHCSEKARQRVPLFLYSFLTSIFVTITFALLSVIFEDSSIDMEGMKGIVGWMNNEYVKQLVFFSVVVGFLGLVGFNMAVKYIHPVVFSTAQLLDPGLTGMISWCWGLEEWPSMFTFVGLGMVSVGLFLLTSYQRSREEATERHNKEDRDMEFGLMEEEELLQQHKITTSSEVEMQERNGNGNGE